MPMPLSDQWEDCWKSSIQCKRLQALTKKNHGLVLQVWLSKMREFKLQELKSDISTLLDASQNALDQKRGLILVHMLSLSYCQHITSLCKWPSILNCQRPWNTLGPFSGLRSASSSVQALQTEASEADREKEAIIRNHSSLIAQLLAYHSGLRQSNQAKLKATLEVSLFCTHRKLLLH